MVESRIPQDASPLIVTALMGPREFAWLDGLRRANFPPERNVLRAHLTMFHHLPPSVLREVRDLLRELTREPAPRATLASVMSLGGGTAFAIASDELASIRAEIAARFAPLLMPQDKAGWRAHVTVQNKVPAAEARALRAVLQAGFVAQPFGIAGLAVWHYRGGPWQSAGAWRFGSGHAMEPPG